MITIASIEVVCDDCRVASKPKVIYDTSDNTAYYECPNCHHGQSEQIDLTEKM